MNKYTEAIQGDDVVILCDGIPMGVGEILAALNAATPPADASLADALDNVGLAFDRNSQYATTMRKAAAALRARPQAVAEAVAKDAAAILVQALEEIAWQRPLGVRPSKSGEAMERAAIIALHKYNALLSAADTRSPDKCQCNDDGKVTDACMDCPR